MWASRCSELLGPFTENNVKPLAICVNIDQESRLVTHSRIKKYNGTSDNLQECIIIIPTATFCDKGDNPTEAMDKFHAGMSCIHKGYYITESLTKQCSNRINVDWYDLI